MFFDIGFNIDSNIDYRFMNYPTAYSISHRLPYLPVREALWEAPLEFDACAQFEGEGAEVVAAHVVVVELGSFFFAGQF